VNGNDPAVGRVVTVNVREHQLVSSAAKSLRRARDTVSLAARNGLRRPRFHIRC